MSSKGDYSPPADARARAAVDTFTATRLEEGERQAEVFRQSPMLEKLLNPTSESDSVSVRRARLKVVPRFGEFCSCCCLPHLPGLGYSIHAT